jgi:hypothetical protein
MHWFWRADMSDRRGRVRYRRVTLGVILYGVLVAWLSSCVLVFAERAVGPGLFDSYPPLPPELHVYRVLLSIAVTISALAIGLLAVLRQLRRSQAAESPLCRHCGYNPTGNVSGVCPECGEQT